MRRLRIAVVILSAVGLLAGPALGSSQAQQPITDDHHWRLDAVVVGETEPPDSNHTLGVNRVAGPSQFAQTGIFAVIDCPDLGDPNVREIVVASLRQENNHTVEFWADDDITDGFGEVTPTTTGREFRDENATEFRTDGDGLPVPSDVRVRIVSGRFHRILNQVEVDLRLDIRVERDDEGLVCQTRYDRQPEIRIVFQLLPDEDNNGFRLIGVATRHNSVYGVDDRTSVARTICDLVGPYSTRVSPYVPDPNGPDDPNVPDNPRPGRDAFHPCAPRYHGA